MDFEPVLLEAPLGAVFDLLTLALGTAVERNELLLELLFIALHETTALVLFCGLFQRAHFIFALAYVNYFVVWRFWDILGRGCASTGVKVIF